MEHFCTLIYSPDPSKNEKKIIKNQLYESEPSVYSCTKTDTLLDLPPVLKGTKARRSQRQETASSTGGLVTNLHTVSSLWNHSGLICRSSFLGAHFSKNINDVKEDLWGEFIGRLDKHYFCKTIGKCNYHSMWTQRIKHIAGCRVPHVMHLYKNTKICTIFFFFLTPEYIKSVCRRWWQTAVSKTNLMKSVSKGFFCDFNISSRCVSSVRLTHWEGCTFFNFFPCPRRNTLCMF